MDICQILPPVIHNLATKRSAPVALSSCDLVRTPASLCPSGRFSFSCSHRGTLIHKNALNREVTLADSQALNQQQPTIVFFPC